MAIETLASLAWAIWLTLCELAPWLLFGMALAGLIHVALPARYIASLRGRGGVLKSVLLGVPLPLCSCGVVPTGLGLKKDGASDGAVIGFLISTPQTGVDSIMVSAAALGWPFAIFKVISAAVTGIVGGILVDSSSSSNRDTRDDAAQGDSDCDVLSHKRALGPRSAWYWRAVEHSVEIVRSVWRWLLLGVVISAAIQIFIPDAVFERVGSWGSLTASLLTLLISLPMYICATASVPIAAELVQSGLPWGAALVFLMAGPATNVATVGAVYSTLGWRNFTIYLSTIVVGSLLSGWLFDRWIGSQLGAGHLHHEHTMWWNHLSALVLVLLFVYFAWQDVTNRWARRSMGRWGNQTRSANQTRWRVPVQGMTCSNCVGKLERELRHEQGIESVEVHLRPGEAIVSGAIDPSRLCRAIHEAGFEAGEAVEV